MARTNTYSQDVHWLDRIHILLVGEGLKPGATLGTGFSKNKDLISGFNHYNLAYIEAVRPPANPDSSVFYISKNKSSLERLVTTSKTVDRNTGIKTLGRFYGYPDCCVDAYISGDSQFPSEIQNIADTKKGYPFEMNYLLPTVTPCSIHCKGMRLVLNSYQACLREKDPMAAAELQEYNRNYITREGQPVIKHGP